MTAPARPDQAPLWHGLDQIPTGFGPSVVTLGVFNGMHRGHARVVRRAVQQGLARGIPTVLVTFDPHPARVLGIPRNTATLTTIDRRAALATELGVDFVCVLPFTRRFAALSPAEFVEHVLLNTLRAEAVVVGSDFTFGHRAAGDVTTLRVLGASHGFTAHAVDLLHQIDTRCSSTHIRECLSRGDIHGATRALGRPHRVEGHLHTVEPGKGELLVAPDTAIPAPGHYRGRLSSGEPADLHITDHGRLLVRADSLHSRHTALDIIDRREVP